MIYKLFTLIALFSSEKSGSTQRRIYNIVMLTCLSILINEKIGGATVLTVIVLGKETGELSF